MTLIIHAPNVHQGGGRTLLGDLLKSAPSGTSKFILDQRMDKPSSIPQSACYAVKPSLLNRLRAEIALSRMAGPQTHVLCFGNLPPLLPNSGRVSVFLQNRYLFGTHDFSGFGRAVRLRLWMERLWFRTRIRAGHQIIVQSLTMQRELKQALGFDSIVLPFLPVAGSHSAVHVSSQVKKQFDFVYVSSAEPHKNHMALLDAWVLLAKQGIHPSLALTVSESTASQVAQFIEQAKQHHGLNIKNFGTLKQGEIHTLYQNSHALIFPSKLESYGLPLLEAQQLGMPILAPELDYVRDVVEPEQTFNPDSPMSIARAVLRHLHVQVPTTEPVDAATFLTQIQAQGAA